MTAPWFQCPHRVWPLVMESMPRPLDPDVAVADLRWWVNETRLGGKFPSSRKLAERWGWGHKRVRLLLKREDPNSVQGTAGAQQGHSEGTAGAQPNEMERRESTGKGTAGAQQGHSEGTAGATRVVDKNQEEEPTTNNNPSSQLALTAPKGKPDHWEAIRGYLITERNRAGASRWDRSGGLGRELARIIKQVGPERTRQLIDLAYDSQAFKHRMNRERGKGHPSMSTLRIHAVEYLEEADEQGLNQAATVAGRPSWDELIAWYDSGSPRGETRRFLNTLPGGWERWQAFLSPRMRERHARTYAQLGGQ